ncbi:DegQ family serine endoprotease [Aureimonas flava]|uniref:DegQ family serine endoprotease n=1 Tax=Aureimonas flava TaxID=2320271 RepID=A0A3A1WM75_9HYPH|nr:DegQ family serine endoprotease [Aureimonas flava]RIY01535.1 DegQ family serine endoprotease [Aureimonas flava]
MQYGRLILGSGVATLALAASLSLAGAQSPPAPTPIAPAAPAERVPTSDAEVRLSFAPLVRKSAPAVVNVYAARQVPVRTPFAGDPFFEQFFGRGEGRTRRESSLGSGVIVDPTGLIVTNHHVIADAEEVRVALADGREFDARVLSKDQQADLAVLKIEGDEPFPSIAIADSDTTQIGDLVLAIGNPFGIGQTVTNGIVSALARTHVGVNDVGYFIQTDAAINPGNSGGALVDMRGELVGVNTAIFSRSGGSNGIGFAIPSNMVRAFADAARAGRPFERPYVGAGFVPVTADIAEALGLDRPTGALVQTVRRGTPADEAGLREGDVVLSMNRFPIDNPDTLGYRLATAGLGGEAELEVMAGDGQHERVRLALEAAPEDPPRDLRTLDGRTPFAGATVANLSPRLAGELEMPQTATGVVVTEVERNSPAARFGLRPKDVIASINGRDLESTEELEEQAGEGQRGWRIEVDRNGQRLVQSVR